MTPRLGVYSGNAEITEVLGRGRSPGDRARIVNWSRGGMCLRVRSPRRKLLFWQREPALYVEDSVRCTLRLAPVYGDIAVDADVVRVERCAEDPDVLEVGLRFDAAMPAERLESIARILEPKPRTTSVRAALPAAESAPTGASARLERQARKSARLERQRASERQARASERLRPAEPTGTELAQPDKPARKRRRAGEPVPLPGEDTVRRVATTSQRLRMVETEHLELRGSARLARQSGRLG